MGRDFGSPRGDVPASRSGRIARYRVTPTSATISGRYFPIFRSRACQPATYSAGFRSSIPGLGRATRLVIPNPKSTSDASSSNVRRLGTSRDSKSSFQKRFDGPAKWCPVCADRTPGLMPTNSTRTPGAIRSASAEPRPVRGHGFRRFRSHGVWCRDSASSGRQYGTTALPPSGGRQFLAGLPLESSREGDRVVSRDDSRPSQS